MSCAAQQAEELDQALRRDVVAYLDLSRDLKSFVNVVQARPEQAPEWELTMDLWRAAVEVAKDCYGAATLVHAYSMIESPPDKRLLQAL